MTRPKSVISRYGYIEGLDWAKILTKTFILIFQLALMSAFSHNYPNLNNTGCPRKKFLLGFVWYLNENIKFCCSTLLDFFLCKSEIILSIEPFLPFIFNQNVFKLKVSERKYPIFGAKKIFINNTSTVSTRIHKIFFSFFSYLPQCDNCPGLKTALGV